MISDYQVNVSRFDSYVERLDKLSARLVGMLDNRPLGKTENNSTVSAVPANFQQKFSSTNNGFVGLLNHMEELLNRLEEFV